MTDPAHSSAGGTEVPAREPQAPPWEPAASPWEQWHAAAPAGGSPVTSGPANGNQAGSADQPEGGTAADSPGPAEGGTAAHSPGPEDRWAMACYLGVIFFWLLAPLAIYLAKRNRSIFIRSHAAQAFNLTLTATLFALSGAIAGGLLTLDSPTTALVVMGPVFLVFWIVVLSYLVRAARSASRSDFYEIPGWLCVAALQ